MATGRFAVCSGCGEGPKQIYRHEGTKVFCRTCYGRLFVPARCERCGRRTTSRPGDAHPVCNPCLRASFFDGKRCARCDKPLVNPKRRVALPDGRVCCCACKRHFEPRQVCEYCGTPSIRLERDFAAGIDKLACGDCRYRARKEGICAGCHRPRRIAGEREDGKGYCAWCLPTGSPPLIVCQDCGRTRHAYSKKRCEDCGWERSHQKLIASLVPQLRTRWARQLFERYHKESRVYTLRGSWLNALRRDIHFFVALENAFPSMQSLTGVLIVRRLGWLAVRGHQRVMSFLAQQRLVVLDEDPDYLLEVHLDRLRKLVPADEGWVTAMLDRFLAQMLKDRAKVVGLRRRTRVAVTPKSIESAIRTARAFLLYARDEHHAASPQGVSQTMLNLYVARNRRARIPLYTFARYVSRHERVFHGLKVPMGSPLGPPHHLVMPEERRRSIIRRLCAASTAIELRWALLALFVGVHAQAPMVAAAMRLDRIRETSEGHEVLFGKTWLHLDPAVNGVLKRWLACRREYSGLEATNESPFLFPGRRATTHLQVLSIAKLRHRYGFTLPGLRASCLAAMVRTGVRQPRVLVDAFGVSLPMAIKYCEFYGAHLGPRAKHVVESHV